MAKVPEGLAAAAGPPLSRKVVRNNGAESIKGYFTKFYDRLLAPCGQYLSESTYRRLDSLRRRIRKQKKIWIFLPYPDEELKVSELGIVPDEEVFSANELVWSSSNKPNTSSSTKSLRDIPGKQSAGKLSEPLGDRFRRAHGGTAETEVSKGTLEYTSRSAGRGFSNTDSLLYKTERRVVPVNPGLTKASSHDVDVLESINHVTAAVDTIPPRRPAEKASEIIQKLDQKRRMSLPQMARQSDFESSARIQVSFRNALPKPSAETLLRLGSMNRGLSTVSRQRSNSWHSGALARKGNTD